MKRVGKRIKYVLGCKITLLIIVLVLAYFAINLGRESYRKYQLNKEISELKAQIEALEGENSQLSNLMDYFKQDTYLEKEARIKLNLKKPGEQVVILPGQTQARAQDIAGGEVKLGDFPTASKTETANYWKWWEYFFSS